MTYEEFEKYVNTIIQFDDYLDRIDNFGINLYETPVSELFYKMQQAYENKVFTTSGIDWVMWWIYDKKEDPNDVLEAYDENGNIIPTNTLKELWDNVIKKELK